MRHCHNRGVSRGAAQGPHRRVVAPQLDAGAVQALLDELVGVPEVRGQQPRGAMRDRRVGAPRMATRPDRFCPPAVSTYGRGDAGPAGLLGRALKVNPIVTILAVLVGASLLGILGALLAIQFAAAIQILLRDWWTHRPAAVVSDAYAPAQNGSTGELVEP
ncbi:MAG: hypothetical protein QOJ85_2056 [Solirubrobacteraceae bacterium]|nr:hypothetical protein [Solirubrobacteraceae bacterium]